MTRMHIWYKFPINKICVIYKGSHFENVAMGPGLAKNTTMGRKPAPLVCRPIGKQPEFLNVQWFSTFINL